MSVLAILLDPRARLSARSSAGLPAGLAASTVGAARSEGYAYVLSPDGSQPSRHGRAQAALLPRASSVVVVLADSDLSWQRITLPKAPAARLRAALAGVLEDHLLEDDEAVHLALAPGAQAGTPVWVAVLHKPWLRAELEKLEAAGLSIERVLPRTWPSDRPDDAAHGHFFEAPDAAGETAGVMLSHADAQGVSLLRLEGSLARSRLPSSDTSTSWSAEPAAAAAAERWLGTAVPLRSPAEHALLALRSPWNLRQFDLAPRRRGSRALRSALRQLLSPAWRPARVGLVALALLQLVGINAWAWQQRQALTELRAAQDRLLRASFPKLRAVLDAPLQMKRETEVLRAASGRAGDDDFETLLGAAAAAWPDGAGPAHTLRFEPGRLSWGAPDWSEPQLAQLRERLRVGGWAVDRAEGRITLSRAAGAGPGS